MSASASYALEVQNMKLPVMEPWIMLAMVWFQSHINADVGISVSRKVERSQATQWNIMQQNKLLHIGVIYFNLLDWQKQHR